MKKSTISERIREAMDIRNLRQADLVERTGISSQKISMYVNGRHEPKLPAIGSLARALEVNEAWLCGFDMPMDRDASMYDGSYALKVETKEIPVLGYVAAGKNLLAEENIIGTVKVDPDLGDNLFALRIKGDSMSPRICDGDTVIVRQQTEAENGQIVIAIVNGNEGVCKKLVKFAGGISLVSLNPSYEPMYFSHRDVANLPVRIIGRVVQNRSDF